MKRKWIAGIMTAMLMGAMVLPVSAEEMTVTYREPNNYILTIPASVNLNQSKTADVSVSNVNLEPNASIRISITSGIDSNSIVSLAREDDTSTTAITTLTVDNSPVALNTVFATFTADGSKTLIFSDLTDSQGGTVKAGNYSGTLIFSVDAPEQN